MNNPPSWTAREESLLLLNAYLDHELDAAAVLDVERRINADATLKAEYGRLLELRSALAFHLTKDRASDALRQSVAAIAAPPRPVTARRPRSPRSYDWRQMAAAAVIAAVLASGGTYLSLRQAAPTNEIAAIVAGHQRALLATAPFDVASSDRHTVKPWFDSKVASLAASLGSFRCWVSARRRTCRRGRRQGGSGHRLPAPGTRDQRHRRRPARWQRHWRATDADVARRLFGTPLAGTRFPVLGGL